MKVHSSVERIEEYDALEQADAVREYLEWDIARLRACVAEMEEKLKRCSKCGVKRMLGHLEEERWSR